MLGYLDDKHRIYTKELYIDELTGALNRRYLNLIIDREIQRSKRYKQKFSIMIADLDNFKTINDTYGHLMGDRALRFFTRTVRESLRSADSIIRYGGDEFIVILPNTDSAGAERVGNRIIGLLRDKSIDGLRISASIGIATFPDHGDSWEDIFKSADKALYTSKRMGKGRVSTPEGSIYTLVLPTQYLVGRREESSWILGCLDKKGVLHIVKGEVGVGKTRLVIDTLKNARVNYAYARSMGPLQNVSYFLIRDLLKNLLNVKRDAVFSTFESLSYSQREEIAKFMPDIFKQHVNPAGLGDKFTLYETLINFISRIGENGFAMVFDDLHWIDKESAEFLHYLIESEISGVSFYGIYRIEELNRSYLTDVITLLGRTRKYDELLLQPLSIEETKAMLQMALGAMPNERLVQVVYEETGGNPFFIEEILRTLHDEGWIFPKGDVWRLKKDYKISPTQNLEQIVMRKIQSLDKRERLVLDFASVYGREIDVMILSRASGYNEGEVFDILDKLVKINILKEGTSSDYVFMEGVIREIIESKLSRGKLKFYHGKVARTIEEVYSGTLKDHLEELVHHYKIAEDIDKVRHYARMAGDKAYEVYAYEKAIEYYSVAIKGLPANGEVYSVRKRLIDSYKSLGKHRKSIEEMNNMLIEYPKYKGELFEMLADSYIRLGEWINAIDYYKKAIELVDSETERYRIEVEMAWALLNLGEHDRAYNILKNAEEFLAKQKDKPENYHMYVWIYTGYATMANMQQRFEKAVTYYKKALEYSEKMKHPYNIAVSHLNLGIALTSLDRVEEALGHFSIAQEISRQNNFLYLYATILQSMSQIYLNQGDFIKARDVLSESEHRFKLMKNYYNLMVNHFNMMEVYVNLYKLDKAMDYAVMAEKLSEELKTPFDYIYARIGIAHIYALKKEFIKSMNILNSVKEKIYDSPDRFLPIRWLNVAGDVSYEKKSVFESLEFYNEALQYCIGESLDLTVRASLHLKLARAYALTDIKLAKEHLQMALNLQKVFTLEYQRVMFKLLLAEVYLNLKDKQKSREILNEILNKCEKNGWELLKVRINEILS